MNKERVFYDILLLFVIYLLSTTTFFTAYIPHYYANVFIQFLLRVGFLLFAFYFIKRNKLPTPQLEKLHKYWPLFIPFFILPLTNIFVGLISGAMLTPVNGLHILIEGFVMNTLIVLSEELVFRVVILSYLLTRTSNLKAIVYSSLIFALTHIVNLGALNQIGPVLIQMGYTFFIGLLCAFLYIFSLNIVLPLIFHFLFNLFNGTLSSALYPGITGPLFYTINISMIVIATLYGVWLYYFLTKKGVGTYVTNTVVY